MCIRDSQRIVARGWGRQHARDYYDLWRILDGFGHSLDAHTISEMLQAKCRHRGVSYLGWSDFFTDELVREARLQWEGSLRPVVTSLPHFDTVLDSLRALLGEAEILR